MRDLSLVSLCHFGRKWHRLMPKGIPKKKGVQKRNNELLLALEGLWWELQLQPKKREDSAALDTNPEQEEFTHYSSLT